MKAIKKFFIIIYVIFLITNLNAHSYPPIEPVPEKFKTWINHYNDLHIEFDFCNYEMSFLDNFKGFGKNCGGSWYASSLSKYLVKNRQYLTENYAFFCRILISPYAQKRSLKESLKTFKLIYDEKEEDLYSLVKKSVLSLSEPEKYNFSSISVIGFIDKELFFKITSAKELYFEYVLDGVVYRIPLQVPVLEDLPTKKDYSIPDFTLTKIKEENETITYKYEYKSDLASVGYVKYGCYEGILEVITKKDSLVPVMNIIEKRESTFGPRLLLEKMNDDGKNLYLKYYIEPYGQKAAGFGYIEVFFTLKDDSYQIADYNCNIESHFSFDEESGAEYPDPDGTIVYHKNLSQEEFLNILFDKSLGF